MAYEGLEPGRYKGKVLDWGVKEVEVAPGNKQLCAVINFGFTANTGKTMQMRWDGFFFKKDGDLNKKTLDTLDACGFGGAMLDDLISNPTALSKTKELDITIEIGKKAGTWLIEWVNDPEDSGAPGKVDSVKSLAGYNLTILNQALLQKKMTKAVDPGRPAGVKNFAPGAGGTTPKDDPTASW